MNKKIIFALIIFILLFSSIVSGESVFQNDIRNKEPTSMGPLSGTEEKLIFGRDYFDIDYTEGCEIVEFGAHAIKVYGAVIWHCEIYYLFNIECSQVVEGSLEFGVYFCDLGLGGDGPTIYAKNFETNKWIKIKDNIGNQDQLTWKWFKVANPNDYVRDDGNVYLKMYFSGLDETILDTVGVRYEKLVPPQLEILEPENAIYVRNVKRDLY